MTTKNFKQYTEVTYSGRRLLEKYSLDMVGTWKVSGEDPNCDMGGYHHSPYIGTFDGKLRDVIMVAVEMPMFWTWGGGGDFELIEIKKVTDKSAEILLAKKQRIAELEAELKKLKAP